MHTNPGDPRNQKKGQAQIPPIKLPKNKKPRKTLSEDESLSPRSSTMTSVSESLHSSPISVSSPEEALRSVEATATAQPMVSESTPEVTTPTAEQASTQFSPRVLGQAPKPLSSQTLASTSTPPAVEGLKVSDPSEPDIQSHAEPMSLETIQKLFHESVALHIKTMDAENIQMILNFDLSRPEKQSEFIEHLEHHFSLGDTTPLGIMDAYEQRQTAEAKADLCERLKSSVRENAVIIQAMKVAKDISDTADALDSLERSSEQGLEQKKSDQKIPTMPDTLRALGSTTLDILMQSLTKDLEALKSMRGPLDRAESFTKKPLGLQPLSWWDEMDSIRNQSRSIFSNLRIIGAGEIADRLEQAYEHEYNLIFSEARKQQILDMKIDVIVRDAMARTKPSMKTSAEIARAAFGVARTQKPSLESFFVGYHMHVIRSGEYLKPDAQKEMEAYFYKLLDTLNLMPQAQQPILSAYQKQSTPAKQLDYIREFVLQVENIIQNNTDHWRLATKIAAAEDYYVADHSIYALKMASGPGGETLGPRDQHISWSPESKTFEVVDSTEYCRRALVVLNDNKMDYEGRSVFLKNLSATILYVAHMNSDAQARIAEYIAPKNQLVLLGGGGADLLLSSLDALVRTIPPNPGDPFIQNLCATLNAVEAGLSELKTLQTTVSFSDTSLKQIKKS